MYKLLLPRLGQTMEEGLLSQWLVPSGQAFDAGAHLYEVETEKVTTEVEANLPGTIVRTFVENDTTIDVGTLLAIIAEPGESPSDEQITAFVSSEALQESVAAAAVSDATAATAPAAPSAMPPALSTAPPATRMTASGPVLAMPRTREQARQAGLDLATLTGSGADGLITEADVASAIAAASAPATAPMPTAAPSAGLSERAPLPTTVAVRERRRLGSIARTMAQVTTRSWQQVPAFSQSVTVRANPWRAARERLRDETGVAIGYTDMILESVVRAIREVPDVNSSFDGDALVIWDDINISIAVDTEAGLLVPVLPRTQHHDMVERAAALTALVERARTGTLTSDDVTGGTITVSNLGMFGIEGGFPMVTAPQSSIVFVGAMHDAVVAVNGAIAVAPVFSLTNAFDHRALDGATAARFTARLRQELEGWR